MRDEVRRLIWAIVPALAMAGCARPAALSVDGAWVRLPAVAGRPGAAYFTVHGGPAEATLIAVRSLSARRGELHESMANGMRPIGSVIVPAGKDAAFAPGGRHVMLFDIDPRVTPGQPITLDLVFADGRSLPAQARTIAAGDPAP